MSRIAINDLTRQNSQMLFDLTEDELALIEGGICFFAIAGIVIGAVMLFSFIKGAIDGC